MRVIIVPSSLIDQESLSTGPVRWVSGVPRATWVWLSWGYSVWVRNCVLRANNAAGTRRESSEVGDHQESFSPRRNRFQCGLLARTRSLRCAWCRRLAKTSLRRPHGDWVSTLVFYGESEVVLGGSTDVPHQESLLERSISRNARVGRVGDACIQIQISPTSRVGLP